MSERVSYLLVLDTMFGPYREIFLSPKEYETVKEFGLAWKILEYTTLNTYPSEETKFV
jgi:hypothetical protein